MRASGAVHLIGSCLCPLPITYSRSCRDIPKSEILTIKLSPMRQLRAAKSLYKHINTNTIFDRSGVLEEEDSTQN